MEFLRQIQDMVLNAVGEPGFWWQFLVLILSLISTFYLQKRYNRWLFNRMGDALASNATEVLLRLTQRLLLPLFAVLVLLVAQAILEELGEPVQMLSLAIPLGLSLAVVRFLVYVLHRTFRPTPGLRAWESAISTIIWAGLALHLLGWLPSVLEALDGPAIDLNNSRISLLSMLKLLISAGFFILLALTLSRVLERNISAASYLTPRMKIGIVKFGRVILLFVAFIIALQSVGINLTALTVFGGAIGVGIGFGLQRIASNFISGFILVLDRSIKPGDVISLDDTFGWVQELRARYLVIRDRDGVERLIPNENLITSQVINWSYSDSRVRLKLPIQIAYHCDPEQAMTLMQEAAASVPRVLNSPAPAARLMEFADSGINLELRIWIADPQNGVTNVRSDVNLNIWKVFKANNIDIPYPQQVIHFA